VPSLPQHLKSQPSKRTFVGCDARRELVQAVQAQKERGGDQCRQNDPDPP